MHNYEWPANPRRKVAPKRPVLECAVWAIRSPAHYNVQWGDQSRFTPEEFMATSAKAAPAKTPRTPRKAPTPAVAKRTVHPRALALDDPSLFINRELSLLDFQRRVLEEAQDPTNPPLDRVMFLSFVGSNLDEFFMVRVAGLKRQIEKGVTDSGPDAMGPAELLRDIRASVIRLNRAAYECWLKELVPALRRAGLRIANFARPHRRSARGRGCLFSGHDLSDADSAGLRSRTPFPAYLEPQPEPGRGPARCRRDRTLCPRQDS